MNEEIVWPDLAPIVLKDSLGNLLKRRGRVVRFATLHEAIEWKRINLPENEGDPIYVAVRDEP